MRIRLRNRYRWLPTVSALLSIGLVLMSCGDDQPSSTGSDKPKTSMDAARPSTSNARSDGTDSGIKQSAEPGQDAGTEDKLDASSCGPCLGGTCCGSECVGLLVDSKHCGKCDNQCPSDRSFCNNGHCEVPTCERACDGGASSCCGGNCCSDGEQCCFNGRAVAGLYCYPAEKECPPPCLTCM